MIYVFGDYALDTGRHELRHAGVPCPLEPQVYDVLLYLILNRDRVVPKQELLDHVWAETFVSEAALYQRLGAARQAVGDSGRTQRVIKTVPKQGYCFSLAVEERDAEAHRSETSDRLAVDALETPPSVATSLPAHRTPIEERKLVTVLCGTLTNAAALAEQVGFEGLGRLRQMFFNLVAAEVQPYEGHLQPFGDDGFLVLFGVRPAQEDHARRAVLAALSLLQRFQESVLDAGTRQQVGLMVRLGGHTGQVMVERRDHTSQELSTAGGATTDLAVRLQTMAGPWQLLISDSMLRLVHGEVRSKRFGPVPVSNQPIPIMAYTVQSLGPWRPFMGQGGGRTLSRFVGRNRELAVLQALCAQAEAGQGQVVGVMGEPGMGKSRLLYEFVQQVDDRPGTYVEGHCLSYGTNTPYLPVLDVLRRLCGITDTDGSDAVSHKVHKALLDDLKQGVPYVFQLLGLTAGTEALSQLTSQMVKKRTFDVLRQLILQRCRQSPLILAVENLHWIDPTSEAWLASLVEHLAQNSLLLLTTYRPGYRPRWMDKSYATQLSLSRLSLEDCMTIVQSVSQTEPLPDTLVQTILSKATGNPFFLEELTQAVIEPHERDLTERLPDTVQAVLSARMDRLPTGPRRLLQIASVIGKDVPLSLLQAVAGLSETMLDQHLQHLQAAEFFHELQRVPDCVYTFKHALTQDAAYQSLLKSTRQQYHRRIAEVLEERFPETIETRPELVAHHYTEAELPEQAISYWQNAGQQAAQRSAYREAISHLTQGLALLTRLPDTEERLHHELGLRAILGPALLARKGQASPEVEETYRRAHALCQQVQETPQLFPVLRGLWNFYLVRGDLVTAHELGEQLFRLARRLGDPMSLTWGYTVQGLVSFYGGAFVRAHEQFAQGISLYDPEQYRLQASRYAQNPIVACQAFAAYAMWLLGYPEQALWQANEALSSAQALFHAYQLASALNFTVRLYHYRREVLLAEQRAETLIALSTKHGFALWLAQGQIQRGWALSAQGQAGEGIPQIQQGLASWRALGAGLWLPYGLALLTEAYRDTGQIDAGLHVLAEALDLVEKHGERFYEAEIHRLNGELLRMRSAARCQEAEACFQQALDLARRQQAKSLELRAAMSLARLWQSQGKRPEAHKLLAPIYNWFTEGFDTADLQEAQALLEASAEEDP